MRSPIAISVRHQFRERGRHRPFVSGGAGLIVTPLDVVELDRTVDGQLFYTNPGLNAFVIVVGAEWLGR